MYTYNFPGDGDFNIDASVKSDVATTNYGNVSPVYLGDFASYAKHHFLCQPDLSNIQSSLLVTSVSLFLTQISELAGTTRDFNVYRILKSWVETTVTWNTRDGSTAWTAGGCSGDGTDYNSTVLATKSLSSSEANGEKEWVFNASGIAVVQAIIKGTYTNYGFVITSDGVDCLRNVATSEDGTPSNRPRFVVTGRLPSAAVCMY
jgi:hypothetical protein